MKGDTLPGDKSGHLEVFIMLHAPWWVRFCYLTGPTYHSVYIIIPILWIRKLKVSNVSKVTQLGGIGSRGNQNLQY